MKFSVPQFIDTEDKIFILLTFKQALYIAGGIGFAMMIWRFTPDVVPGIFKIVLATFPVSLGLALAFVKYNMRPFIYFFEAAIMFFINPRKYTWKKKQKKIIFEQKIVTRIKDDKNNNKVKKSRIDIISENLDLLNK